jgi:hypothetical protein
VRFVLVVVIYCFDDDLHSYLCHVSLLSVVLCSFDIDVFVQERYCRFPRLVGYEFA